MRKDKQIKKLLASLAKIFIFPLILLLTTQYLTRITESEMRSIEIHYIKASNYKSLRDDPSISLYEISEFSKVIEQCTLYNSYIGLLYIDGSKEIVDLSIPIHIKRHELYSIYDYTSDSLYIEKHNYVLEKSLIESKNLGTGILVIPFRITERLDGELDHHIFNNSRSIIIEYALPKYLSFMTMTSRDYNFLQGILFAREFRHEIEEMKSSKIRIRETQPPNSGENLSEQFGR